MKQRFSYRLDSNGCAEPNEFVVERREHPKILYWNDQLWKSQSCRSYSYNKIDFGHDNARRQGHDVLLLFMRKGGHD